LNEFSRQFSRILLTIVSSIYSVLIIKFSDLALFAEFSKLMLLAVFLNSMRDFGLNTKIYYSLSNNEYTAANFAFNLMLIFFMVSICLLVILGFLLNINPIFYFSLTFLIFIPFVQTMVNIIDDFYSTGKMNFFVNIYFVISFSVSFFTSIFFFGDKSVLFFSLLNFCLTFPALVFVLKKYFNLTNFQFIKLDKSGLRSFFVIFKEYSVSNISYSIYQRFVPFVITMFLNDFFASLFAVFIRVINLLNEPVSIYFSGRGSKVIFSQKFISKKFLIELSLLYLMYSIALIFFFFYIFPLAIEFLGFETKVFLFDFVLVFLFSVTFIRGVNSLFSVLIVSRAHFLSLSITRAFVAILSALGALIFNFNGKEIYIFYFLLSIEVVLISSYINCLLFTKRVHNA